MPQICLTVPDLGQARLKELSISNKNYTNKGVWVNKAISSLNEDEILQQTLTKLSEIGNPSLLGIFKRTASNSDKYVKETFTANDIINGTKITLLSLDYYFSVGGILCFDLVDWAFPYGIERLYVYTKLNLRLSIISPGNYYSSDRKRNQFDTESGYTYKYEVLHLYFLSQCSGILHGVQGPIPVPQPLLHRYHWPRG